MRKPKTAVRNKIHGGEDDTLVGALRRMIRAGAPRERVCAVVAEEIAAPAERPTFNPNPYTYDPGPPKVTAEQLQALIDAIGRRRG